MGFGKVSANHLPVVIRIPTHARSVLVDGNRWAVSYDQRTPTYPQPRPYLPGDRLWYTGSRPSIPPFRRRRRLEWVWVSCPGLHPMVVGTPNYTLHISLGRPIQWLCRLPR